MADWFEKLEIDPPNQNNDDQKSFKPQIPEINFRKIMPIVAGILILLFIIIFRPWYTVQPGEKGVVLRLGKYNRTASSGLHFRLPFPIEEVYTPNVTLFRRIEIGFSSNRGDPRNTVREVEDERQMLTGDENVVESEMIVQYQIDPDRPQDYLFNVVNVDETLKDLAEAAERQVIGDNAIDMALTDGRVQIQNEIFKILVELSQHYRMGIIISEVQLQTTQAPKPVEPAFLAVVDARENQNQSVNEGETYRNSKIPEAEGKVQETLQDAEAYRAERVSRAKGEVERFSNILQEYRVAPEITRARLYLETLEKVLPGKHKVIISNQSQSDVLKFLNITPNSTLPGTLSPGKESDQ